MCICLLCSSALIAAADKGHVAVVRYLLGCGVDVHAADGKVGGPAGMLSFAQEGRQHFGRSCTAYIISTYQGESWETLPILKYILIK